MKSHIQAKSEYRIPACRMAGRSKSEIIFKFKSSKFETSKIVTCSKEKSHGLEHWNFGHSDLFRPALVRRCLNSFWSLQNFASNTDIRMLCKPGLPAIRQAGLGQGFRI